MNGWPQSATDLLCPFCGHSQNTDGFWEDGPGIEDTIEMSCQGCDKSIQVTQQAITWYEVRPNDEQMKDPNCERCKSEDHMLSYVLWDEGERNAYHHDDQRPQGGKIEKVFHDPPFQDYAA